ncbi:MAG TPA: hypothetical protein VN796_10680 [Acidimicrobiales bacterium]|nr:hypothetical protein [Acidimicrobiales bacterium]
MVVAVGLFAVVSVLQWFVDGSGQAIAVLYILPIALLGVTRGERGGLAGATAGFVLFAVLEIVHSSGDIDATGWAVRAIAMFLLGELLGYATDQTIASEQTALDEQRKRCQLEEANHRYAEAIELNDSLIQEMVAAKWMVERGLTDQAAEILSATIAAGERMVVVLLPKRAPRPQDMRPTARTPDPVLAQFAGDQRGRRAPLGQDHE